jgi:hypothetical protein
MTKLLNENLIPTKENLEASIVSDTALIESTLAASKTDTESRDASK